MSPWSLAISFLFLPKSTLTHPAENSTLPDTPSGPVNSFRFLSSLDAPSLQSSSWRDPPPKHISAMQQTSMATKQ
ncbi:hypothetical protein RRG08_047239 [Elysia crispata]|uniref:Secreted protein n=1 Tax=Elysia crispata TaxID=231223 RepID=A0AAE1A2M8_9GAST|nr:hypothetical protein RRG08_047239 [Elysia crispata]